MPRTTERVEVVHSRMGKGYREITITHYESSELAAALEKATTFSEVIIFFHDNVEVEWEEDDDLMRLFQKAFGLITTTQEAIELFRESGNYSFYLQEQNPAEEDVEDMLRDKMLKLAATVDDLDAIYFLLAEEESEIARRSFIRKLFDKADELDYPAA